MNNSTSNSKKETKKLGIILTVCVLILIFIAILLIKTLASAPTGAPQIQYIELLAKEGMTLQEAESILTGAGINYEIIPTQSRTPNRVEKIEYIGKVEEGKTLIEVGTTVKLHANKVENNKIIYLTFDDGPIVKYTDSTLEKIYYNTGEMLDVLDSYGIKASFFLAGYQMVKPDRSQYVSDIYSRGHLIACHSYSHDYDNIYNSTPDLLSDIERFENELNSLLGEEIYNSMGKYIRFPGGTNNSYLNEQQRMEFITAVRESGYKIYDWTLLINDADDRERLEGESDRDYYFRSLKNGLEAKKDSGKPLILLMHDTYSTKNVLPELLDYLISEGFYFDTIDNCSEYTFVEN